MLGTLWGDSPVGYHWGVTVDNFCPQQTGPPAPWTHRCLLVLNEPREGALSRVWENIAATARLRRVVVVIHERPGGKRLSRTHYRRYSTNDVTCTELAIFPAGTICFGHAAGWNDYADANGMSANSNRASSRHSHTWTCDEDGNLVVPGTHCPGVLRRHDGLLNKKDVRILLLGPPSITKKTPDSIRIRDVRKLAFLLGGTGGRTSGNPKDGPVCFGSEEAIRLDWHVQVNDSELDFTAPWRQARWMRDSLSPMSLPVGAVKSGHHETALKLIQALHAFADRDLQGLIIPHGTMPVHVSKLLPLLGWYTGILKSFHLVFTKAQLTVVFNLSELHKAHVLHHWRLVGIIMISQEVKHADANTVANCHLCNHPFWNLYEITESGDEEKKLFAAVNCKHQIEADRIIGGIGSAAAVTVLRDALLSTALYVCLACAAPDLGAQYQRREAQENVPKTKTTDTDSTAANPITVALGRVARAVVPESQAMPAGGMLVASHEQMATDSAPRRSERVTQQPARLLHVAEISVAPTTPLRNVAYESKAVTADSEMRAIVLHPDGKQTLLERVSASKALRLLKKFRQGYCPLIDQTFSSCDPVPPVLHAKVRIEECHHIVNLPWLQVGQQGTITSVRKDVIYVTLDTPPAPMQVTTVLTPASTLLGIYTGPPPIPLPPSIQHAKVHLSVEQQSSVRGICATRMWRVHEIAPSATSTQLVVHALPADAPARRGGNLSNSCTQFPLETVIQLLKEAGVVSAADASASSSGKPSEAALPDADNLDLANMPATFDFEGDETAWHQGLPPGEVGPQMSELELSDSNSDSSVDSIFGACLDGFDGDAWMSDAEGAHDDIQVGDAAGVNDFGDIPWRTTAWSAGGLEVGSVKAAKRASEGRKQPTSTLSGQTVTFDPQGVRIGENGDRDGAARGGVAGEGATDTLDLQEVVHGGSDANGERMGGGVTRVEKTFIDSTCC